MRWFVASMCVCSLFMALLVACGSDGGRHLRLQSGIVEEQDLVDFLETWTVDGKVNADLIELCGEWRNGVGAPSLLDFVTDQLGDKDAASATPRNQDSERAMDLINNRCIRFWQL